MTKDKKQEMGLSINSDDGLNIIKAMTGELLISQSKAQYISFNGNDGKFYQGAGEEKIEIGDSVNGVILKISVKAETGYGSKKRKVRTDELASLQGIITLKDGDTGEDVETGAYEDLKDKYDLKFKQILYIDLDEMGGEVVKLTVSGSSLSPLWSYLAKPGKQKSIIQFTTKFSSIGYDSDLGGKKFKMKFEQTGEIEGSELQTRLDKLSAIGGGNKKTQKLDSIIGGNIEEIAF